MPDDYLPHRPRARLYWLVVIVGVAYAIWLIFALVVSILARFGTLRPWQVCPESASFYCGQVTGLATNLLGLALGAVIFLCGWYAWLTNRYRSTVLREPERVVHTATGQQFGWVVGRDELCTLLLRRLRDRDVRRPLILVGGIGTGKTATLTLLAQHLADRRLVPIGLDLRGRRIDKEQDLDFLTLAREEFLSFVDPWLWSAGQGDTAWRWLRRRERIVVLADGLEQVDVGSDIDRDSVLRYAIGQAAIQDLPLVIASRPSDPLRGMNASVLQLEPLSEGAALQYVLGPDPTHGAGWARVADLVRLADIAESPVYLRIIDDLRRSGKLEKVAAARDDRQPRDRCAARWHLLESWREALISGWVHQDYGVSKRERSDVVEILSALACLGLIDGTAEVNPTDLLDPANDFLVAALRQNVTRFNPCLDSDLGLAQALGVLLGLVERLPNGRLRFPDGALHAYLGSRYLRPAIEPDQARFRQRMQAGSNRPSRELLIAMTLFSRSEGQPPSPVKASRAGGKRLPARADDDRVSVVATLCAFLTEALCQLASRESGSTEAGPGKVLLPSGDRTRAVEMFAAAFEIDGWSAQPAHPRIVAAVAANWHTFQEDHSVTDRPLGEAKLALMHRFGAAARLLVERESSYVGAAPGTPAYRMFFDMICGETSYPVRLVAVRQIAIGGGLAARQLADRLQSPLARPGPEHHTHEEQLRGWLLPLLYLYSQRHLPPQAQQESEARAHDLLRAAVDRFRQPTEADDLTRQMHLAQGFRLAANCRVFDDGGNRRQALIEQAERLLRHVHLWYAHLALLQALTLLSLPEDPHEWLPYDRPVSDPRGLVDYWLSIAGGGPAAPEHGGGTTHPLVQEAAELCVLALRSGHPERYCWIDERDIVSRVGDSEPSADIRGEQESWLPESVGWAVLDQRAQRLLADVMLLLNLTGRYPDDPPERDRLLARSNRSDLPPCLTGDRAPLQASRDHPIEKTSPGATCVADCPFRLCPLPAPNEDLPHQIDEAFCSRQVELATWHPERPSRASWQLGPRSELQRFWRQMSSRMLPRWRR